MVPMASTLSRRGTVYWQTASTGTTLDGPYAMYIWVASKSGMHHMMLKQMHSSAAGTFGTHGPAASTGRLFRQARVQ